MHLRPLHVFVLALALYAPYNRAEIAPAPKPLPLHSALQEKNFYLLSRLQTDPELRRALASDKALGQIASTRTQRLQQALQTCSQDAACRLQPLDWSDQEIQAVSAALSRIYRSNPHLRKILDAKLQASGTYALYEQRGAKTPS